MLECKEAIQDSHDRCGPGDGGLVAAAARRLHSSGFSALRTLRCEVTEGVVIVHGVVSSYYLKQMAQTVVLRLDGVRTVKNLVEVR
jgi:BON domain